MLGWALNLGFAAGPTVAVEEVTARLAGGFLYAVDNLLTRRRQLDKERFDKEDEAERIKDKLLRDIAREERRLERIEARRVELQALTDEAKGNWVKIELETNARIKELAVRAVASRTFSAMEQFERELFQMREEEEFILLATQILVNNQ